MDSSDQSTDEDTTRVFLRPALTAPTRRAGREGNRTGLWNPADVAAFLQVSRSWVYQKAEGGLIPVIRMPGSSLLRFEPEAIRAFARGEWVPAKIQPVHAVKRRK